MKILLDECVNRRFARAIPDHEVATTTSMGWNGIRNGQLLARAVDAGFEVFVTLDKNLSFQNDISSIPIAVLVLRVRSNRLTDLKPLVPKLLAALTTPVRGAATVLRL